MTDLPTLILASGSPYRRALLERLGLAFQCKTPGIDESRNAGEPAERYVRRLAEAKAAAAAPPFPALVIGSDQAAVIDDTVLGKPGTEAQARQQLAAASGRRVSFLTGLCVLDTRTRQRASDVVPFHVHFRTLSTQEIARYVAADQPLDCAGSFRAEGLGVTLFERMEGDDPTALIGLPLIRLAAMLRQAGMTLP